MVSDISGYMREIRNTGGLVHDDMVNAAGAIVMGFTSGSGIYADSVEAHRIRFKRVIMDKRRGSAIYCGQRLCDPINNSAEGRRLTEARSRGRRRRLTEARSGGQSPEPGNSSATR